MKFQQQGYDFAPGEPRVDLSNRDSIIRWLKWNDRNGSYSDHDSDLEGLPRLTLDTAREALVNGYMEATGEEIEL